MDKGTNKSKSVKAVPEGFHTVTPYLIVDGAAKFIDFLKSAFNAKQTFLMPAEGGKIMHATVTIGNSLVMISDSMEDMPPKPCMLYLYLDNVDATYKQAVAAKATSVHEPTDEFYGDRAGAVKDAWDNVWWIATHNEDVDDQELKRRAKKAQEERAKKGNEVHA